MQKVTYLFFYLNLFFLCATMPLDAAAINGTTMEGVCLEKVVKGKKLYSIEAQKAVFANKRIGFFNLSLVKVIDLEEVTFILYNDGQIVKTLHFPKAVFELNSRRLLDADGNLIFLDTFPPHRDKLKGGE